VSPWGQSKPRPRVRSGPPSLRGCGMSVTAQAPAELVRRLEAAGQSHLLRFYESLAPGARERLVERISAIDLEAVPALVRDYVLNKPRVEVPENVEPAPYYPHDGRSGGRVWDRAQYRSAGEALLRAGKVAAFTV